MNKENLAYKASLKSREYVQTHNKQGWLGLFSENGMICDPIGKSILDPVGKGHGTPEARQAFWDKSIANSQIKITIHDSHTADLECANIVTLDVVLELDGTKYSQQVNGIFTYCANEAGLLLSLRGYWEEQEGLKTLKPLAKAA